MLFRSLPQLPRLIHRVLAEDRVTPLQQQVDLLRAEQQKLRQSLLLLLALFATSTALALALFWMQ